MALNKFDPVSDAIADLYRASFYLAKKSKSIGISLLLKAKKKLGKEMFLDVDKITKKNALNKPANYIYWAEKILDEYKRLRIYN